MSDAEEEQPVAEVEAEDAAEDVEADEAPAAAAPAEPMDVNTAVQVRSLYKEFSLSTSCYHARPSAVCCGPPRWCMRTRYCSWFASGAWHALPPAP